MAFIPFALEEWQSRHETEVEFNLADSGVQAVVLEELLGDPTSDAVKRLLALDLHYPPVGGTLELRERIADWHPGAHADDVLVTVGAAEANAIVVDSLVELGDHVVVMEPGYRQVRGCAENAGAVVDAFPLDPDRGWRPDLAALDSVVKPGTRLIAITNPSNPVGTILTEAELDAVIAAADRVGAWLLADEVYRGTERLTDAVTPSLWGRYDKVVCTGSLSKAFALPGLRLGWLIAPPDQVQAAWRRHEYATISASTASMYLAEMALEPGRRAQLLERTRRYIREGYARLDAWIQDSQGLLSLVPPDATALAFVRYHLDIPSVTVADHLRTDASVLVGPGAHFGIEHHLRITHGIAADALLPALDRVSEVLARLVP